MLFRNICFISCILFQAAEKLEMAVFVHPWDMQLDGRMKDYWLPWLVGENIMSTELQLQKFY